MAYTTPDDLPPSLPLDALDDVPWADLRHAYGPAADVPDQIRALLGQGDTRLHAGAALDSNIYHQGTRYLAAPYAVPFFVGLLDQRELRSDLLTRLLLLAVGFEGHWFPTGYDLDGAVRAQAELDDGINEWGIDIVVTHRQVAKAWRTYVDLLEDPTVGAQAAQLLAYLPGVAHLTIPELTARLPSASGDVWASTALAIALLSNGTPDAPGHLLLTQQNGSEVENVAGLCARSILGDRAVLPELARLLSSDLPRIGHWLYGQTPDMVALSIEAQERWLEDVTVESFAKAIRTGSWQTPATLAAILLRATFTGPPPDSPAEMSTLQRRVLTVLLHNGRWPVDSAMDTNWLDAMAGYALPVTAADMARYLAGEPLRDCLAPPQLEALDRYRSMYPLR